MIKINTFNPKLFFTIENILPGILSLAYYFIALVLLISGISKILNPENFLNTLNVTLNFIGENITILIATALPVIEVSLSLMLLFKIKVKAALLITLILFIGFLLFAVYGFIAGFDVDCGCFGSIDWSEFGVGMIIRNIFLLILSIVLYKIRNKIGFNKNPKLNNIHHYI